MDEKPKDSSEVPTPKVMEISKESVTALGEKLDDFAQRLSGDERLTLATAFVLAGRGLSTFSCAVHREGGLRVGIGPTAVVVEPLTDRAPSLSGALSEAFCPKASDRFSIEGLEVEKTMVGSKSVAAGMGCRMGAKSVAAGFACRAGAKSVAAGFACRGGAKSVAAAAQGFQCRGAKSVAAAQGLQCFGGAKSVAAQAACFGGAKSVAAWNSGFRR